MPRPRVYRTSAIVLKRMNLGEADRILTVYSREMGKIRVVARGVRRPTSRSGGHLELFTLARIQCGVGRELDVVAEAETITSFRSVREDVSLTASAYYLAEVTDIMTEERMENEELFEALFDGLSALGGERPPRLVVLHFQVRVLRALGYEPELRECVICRAEIVPDENRFSAHLGGVLCPRCGGGESSSRPIQSDVLKLLRHLQRLEGPLKLNAPELVTRQAEVLARDYTEQVVERRLRSPALIARVQQAAEQAGL